MDVDVDDMTLECEAKPKIDVFQSVFLPYGPWFLPCSRKQRTTPHFNNRPTRYPQSHLARLTSLIETRADILHIRHFDTTGTPGSDAQIADARTLPP